MAEAQGRLPYAVCMPTVLPATPHQCSLAQVRSNVLMVRRSRLASANAEAPAWAVCIVIAFLP